MNYKRPIDVYNYIIVPKIKEIDLFLKTDEKMCIKEISNILDISENELKNILIKINQNEINKSNFFKIMINGKSFICEILKREMECGSPYFYNAEVLSYIYELDYEKVLKAYRFLNLDKITSSQIPTILLQL